eukprot:scaffold57725_cov31-Tisochrysis_lutea.AAC.4
MGRINSGFFSTVRTSWAPRFTFLWPPPRPLPTLLVATFRPPSSRSSRESPLHLSSLYGISVEKRSARPR